MNMINRLLKIITSLGLFSFIVSCASITSLKLDVLRPATISIDPEILSVVVVDKSLPYRGENVHSVTIPSGTAIIDTLWIDDFSQIAAESMFNTLQLKMFFDTVCYHNNVENRYLVERGFIPEEILREIIEDLCYIHNVQAVVFLESYKYKTALSLLDLKDVYYGSLDVNGSIFWKMYDERGNLLDMFVQTDSIFWDTTGNRFSAILKELPAQTVAVETLAEYLGETYIGRISPYWETVSRKYYSKGHHLFERANDLHFANNWNEAAKVWYYVYQNGNKPQKARAAFNIALSYEVRGDFEEALAWSEINNRMINKMGSFRVSNYEKHISKMYNIQLIERQQQKKKLDEQLGPQ